MFSIPLLLLSLALATPEEPRSRALSRALTSSARLAGTSGSEVGARTVARTLEKAGWTVELDRREVLLSYPRRIHLRATSRGTRDAGERVLFERHETFDPDQRPAQDVPKFNAWSGSGTAEADVVDVGRGLRADFERLKSEGVDVAGKIALASYGGAYRGVKAELAQAAGCVAVLLCSPSAQEGADRGPTWPKGPWKPDDAAQRGAIGSLSVCPGDPSTPGWASPAVGESAARRLAPAEYDARLPRILCTPLGVGEGEALRAALGRGEQVRMQIELDVPRSLRRIVNVIARLPGKADGWVIAGNHRDAWVRGAQDAASGTVALLRAAERLGERTRGGWSPERGLLLAFWDAEEYGLIGSTEWAEANADWLARDAIAYVNADAVVSGTNFRAGGTPGLEAALEAALARVPSPTPDAEGTAPGNLRDRWLEDREERTLRILGSGSDYTVFLHHLGLPVLDIGFGGNQGGGYHTRFDDFGLMDRFLDPGWVGHELAGHFVAELLEELATRGFDAFDDARAARAMAAQAMAESGNLLDGSQAERLAKAFQELAQAITDAATRPNEQVRPRFFQVLATARGLDGRPWYRNRLWAPGLETGYAPETFPELRAASDEAEREALVDELIVSIAALQRAWER